MKLLLDENLSDKIVSKIIEFFPQSTHVKPADLCQADDEFIWKYAAKNDFTIVSKDADFHQRSLLFGFPPKFIFLKLGNCSTNSIVHLLRENHRTIEDFISDKNTGILLLR